MCKENRKIWLVGIGMGNQSSLTKEAEQILEDADCIIGAKRMTAPWEKRGKLCICEYDPKLICEYILSHQDKRKIAIALSGDVGFYSGARKLETLLEEKTTESFAIHRIPGISSVVYLASALHTSWEDAKLVSLHGRRQNYIDAIFRNEKTFLLLGGINPQEVIGKLKDYGFSDCRIFVGKNLSYAEEKIMEKRVGDLMEEDLEGLCVALVVNEHPFREVKNHIPDEAFERGKVPMTKAEVRSVCIAKLGLTKDAVLYDVGAGTGSIAIEAAMQSDSILVYAIEKNEEGVQLIEKNKRKFCADGVCVIEGTAPEALKDLEKPTHVFIGGSSGNLKDIIRCVKEKNSKVKIVLTSISLDTLKEVMEAVEEGILREPEIVQLSVAKAKILGSHHMMMGQNPIYVITEERA